MNKIKVLAVGPGSPDYLPPVIAAQVEQCDVLVGGRRNLALFNISGQEKIEITGKLAPVIEAIRAKAQESRVGVLVSGDTGIYSILPRLTAEFGSGALEVFPGISAMQYMFARLGLTWQDASFISLHGRDLDDLPGLVASSQKLALFTDSKNSPAAVCTLLSAAAVEGKLVHIGEDLSYPTEKISSGRPGDFCSYSGSDLNLVVIIDG